MNKVIEKLLLILCWFEILFSRFLVKLIIFGNEENTRIRCRFHSHTTNVHIVFFLRIMIIVFFFLRLQSPYLINDDHESNTLVNSIYYELTLTSYALIEFIYWNCIFFVELALVKCWVNFNLVNGQLNCHYKHR